MPSWLDRFALEFDIPILYKIIMPYNYVNFDLNTEK